MYEWTKNIYIIENLQQILLGNQVVGSREVFENIIKTLVKSSRVNMLSY